MRPYGERHKFLYNYKDNHPKKGWINWWEDELGNLKSKKTERQRDKKEIKKQLEYLGQIDT